MSESDKIKEKIGYYKFWLGIFTASDLATLTWLFQNFSELDTPLIAGSFAIITFLSSGVLKTHRSILKHIESLKNL